MRSQERYRLTEEEFTTAASTMPRVAKRNVELAREVLVNGKGLSEVGREYGVARQSVQHYRDKVYSAYLMKVMVPPSWVKQTVYAPKEMLDDFLDEVEQERVRYFSEPRD
ncbi:hypothetical protein ECGR_2524 [Escherichia coli]|uniref:TrfB transcriptional repressor protein domain-containing protein n=1 Tax=Salmonella enterica subsp. enterica serovar 4,[5],12:i:- TaxID=440524 RepID=A0A8D5IQH6_SALET|nr:MULTISPECIES: TrfB-related DNA-binding protein [Pseudomonadota]PJX19982.1 hypothetical protein CAP48_19450 [Advenella sp. S44]BCI29594.1 hypothetical protein SEL4596_P1490 [Salmonella enterica subsp. enterica serovar 4,[5],12:i:-]GJJ30461.1 hypothetical protein ECGR_2524 [Escherichia coli]